MCVKAILPHLDALVESAPEGGLRIYDVGCGNGLSGVPFRALDTKIAALDGMDLSPGMVDEAKVLGCYDKLTVASLDEPLDYADNSVDLIACVGTFSYVKSDGPCMDEMVRVGRPGALVVFTHRGPYSDTPSYYEEAGWKAAQAKLEAAGKWGLSADLSGLYPSAQSVAQMFGSLICGRLADV